MSLTTRVLLGLVAGLVAGIVISLVPSLMGVVPFVEPIGTLFINAIRMTVVPLVFACLLVGVADAADARVIGRLGRRSLVVFVVTALVAAIFAVLVAHPLLGLLSIDPAASASLREVAATSSATVEAGTKQVPSIAQWIVSLVPVNPVKAAADGAMLPLIVFAIAFGIAILKLPEQRREPLVSFFRSVFDAMLVLVRWVLELAPIGVFALALPLAARLGLSAAGAVAYYMALVSLVCVLFVLLFLFPTTAVLGRTPMRLFARAITPALAVAFSSRSSLAALPVMIEESNSTLKLPAEISSFFLPLATSVFRSGSAAMLTIGVLFVARLYGVELGITQLASVVVTATLVSFSVPAIPSGSILVMVPVMMAAGVPVAGIGILLGIDTIPDMFRTTTNVIGSMSAATLVAREAPAPVARFVEQPDS
ncbi:MAG TPA: dicarboxylate/amino acid:cation symporter [Gemmatimonadaceae bacterium]|nr:dicarboxylate/amino acid:cation symporter [Gemmatimonadaceae bacterium]